MLLFSWFERKLDPFPAAEPVEPPKTLVAFCLHYTRGAWPYILRHSGRYTRNDRPRALYHTRSQSRHGRNAIHCRRLYVNEVL
jgi:hypothetical protein